MSDEIKMADARMVFMELFFDSNFSRDNVQRPFTRISLETGNLLIAAQSFFVMLATRFYDNQLIYFMSQHPSLRAASTLGGKRNVLKRFERTALLKKRGQWKAGERITGLRKTKPDA